VTGLEQGAVKLQDIFHYVYQKQEDGSPLGALVPTGCLPDCLEDLYERGVEVDRSLFEVSA